MPDSEIKIIAFQVAENLSIKKIRAHFSDEPLYNSSNELFYQKGLGFIYILSYGMVVFADQNEDERSSLLNEIRQFADNPLPEFFSEDFIIFHKPGSETNFAYNHLIVPEINPGIIRVCMLQVAQSSALDFYMDKAGDIFNETVRLASQLEKEGKIKESRKKILKFIGRTMNTKNRIIDDLYVIDSPPSVWENEKLGYIYDGLSNTFDIRTRFRELEYILKNIESNLQIFIELAESRRNTLLEIIIIVLILFEVIHVIIKEVILG